MVNKKITEDDIKEVMSVYNSILRNDGIREWYIFKNDNGVNSIYKVTDYWHILH